MIEIVIEFIVGMTVLILVLIFIGIPVVMIIYRLACWWGDVVNSKLHLFD